MSVYIIDKCQKQSLALQHILSLLLMCSIIILIKYFRLLVLVLGVGGFHPFHDIFFPSVQHHKHSL